MYTALGQTYTEDRYTDTLEAHRTHHHMDTMQTQLLWNTFLHKTVCTQIFYGNGDKSVHRKQTV